MTDTQNETDDRTTELTTELTEELTEELSDGLSDELGEELKDDGDTDLLVQEGDIAGDYLERLLDIADVDGDLDMDVEGSGSSARAVVAIVGEGLDALVGPNGQTLEALQELTRLAVVQQTGVRSRLMLDIGGYRARRKVELTEIGSRAAQRALEERQPVKLAPMTPFERKVVHDAVAAVDGVTSESEGVEPERRVVVVPV